MREVLGYTPRQAHAFLEISGRRRRAAMVEKITAARAANADKKDVDKLIKELLRP